MRSKFFITTMRGDGFIDRSRGTADTLVFNLFPWIVVGVFLAGLALALYLRARSPERYRTIGHIIYEDATERPGSDADADGRGDRATGAKAT